MGALAQLTTFTAGIGWRLLPVDPLGRFLVGRTESGDDDVRRLALMALVSAGDRGVEQVDDAYRGGSTSTELLFVLRSVAGPLARTTLARLAEHPDEALRGAADRALAELGAVDPGTS